MSSLKKVLISAVFFSVLTAPTASAYTGSYGIAPATTPGPNTSKNTNIDIDTTAGTQTIIADLQYVYKIVIETSVPLTSHLIVKEYPADSDYTFDIIVNDNNFRENLVRATFYVWAPNVSSLTIVHDHQGAATVYETASKVSPVVTNDDGNVLWEFTVTNFSSFSWPAPAELTVSNNWLNYFNLLNLFLIFGATMAAPLALRRN